MKQITQSFLEGESPTWNFYSARSRQVFDEKNYKLLWPDVQ